jgi:hypothetical protein
VFFILVGGTTLANFKLWLKIQRPYVGGADGQDIRDILARTGLTLVSTS